MKRFLMSLLIMSWAIVRAQTPVILTAGQSNADGRVPMADFPSDISYKYCMWSYGSGDFETASGEFAPFSPRVAKPKIENSWGFDAIVYNKLEKVWNRPFYVIKHTDGGTAIDPSCKSSTHGLFWSADPEFLKNTTSASHGGKSLLLAFERQIDDCLKNLPKDYDIKFMLWHQGESDQKADSLYYDNLKEVIAHVRQHLVGVTGRKKYGKLPVVCGNYSLKSRMRSQRVADALERLAGEDENFHVVDASDLPLLRDRLHFNAEGAQILGQRVVDKLVSIAQNAADDVRNNLWQSFLTPPDSIRVGCYYYWINERVDPKGVKADLEWMKDNGITLAFLATDIRNRVNGDLAAAAEIYGKNKFQSKLWWKNLRTALKTAGKLGIEMGIFNCPGWSQSGGPWIKPEEAMRNWTPNGIEVCKTKQGTDVVCSPCSPEAEGLEVDKLSKTHVKKHFEAFFGEILRKIPAKDRPTLTTVVVDSWERGKQNYTDSIFVLFERRFGYPLDYTNDACKKDLDRLIADLVASEYMGGLTEKAHEYGLRTWCEPYAHSPFPGNSITYGSAADEVAAEFWVGDKKFRKKEIDAAVGAARRSGKNRVWAESFTDGWPELAKDDWSYDKLKPIADKYFHAGVNASILHVVISQPGDEREPAVRPWFGTYFDRRSAHAADLKPLVTYLRRCNFMLQLGKPLDGAADKRIMADGTVIRFTEDSQFEVTFPDGRKEMWNPEYRIR